LNNQQTPFPILPPPCTFESNPARGLVFRLNRRSKSVETVDEKVTGNWELPTSTS